MSTYFDRTTAGNLNLAGGVPDVVLIDFYKDDNIYRSSITHVFNESKAAHLTYTDVTSESLDDVIKTTVFSVALLYEHVSTMAVLYDMKESVVIREINLLEFAPKEIQENNTLH